MPTDLPLLKRVRAAQLACFPLAANVRSNSKRQIAIMVAEEIRRIRHDVNKLVIFIRLSTTVMAEK